MTEDNIKLGLTLLANTHKFYPGSWFLGHRGAAILAASFLANDRLLPVNLNHFLQSEIVRISKIDDSLATRIDTSDVIALDSLIEQLKVCLSDLSTDAHGVIFGVLSLRALSECPELAEANLVSGIIGVLANSVQDDVRRYIGIDDYKSVEIPEDYLRNFNSSSEAAIYSLHQHTKVIPDQIIDGKMNFLAGDQLHLITHAHALLELEKLGYTQLAELGLNSLRKHFYLIERRIIPDTCTECIFETPLDPRVSSFWMRNKTDEHYIKLTYSVLSIASKTTNTDMNGVLLDISKYWQIME